MADNPNAVPAALGGGTMSRPGTGSMAQSRPGTGKIWTVEGDEKLDENGIKDGDDDLTSLSPSTVTEGLSEEDTKILLEKEFDDYYEDRVHKSAGPVVFLSKCMAMLPVIWTDDEAESECKTYFNLYTFVVFLAWFGLAIISALRVCKMDDEITWPSTMVMTGDNSTSEKRFLSRMTVDSYIGCIFSNCICATLFGIFKCTSFAEVLYTTSSVDSQLELKEKHYDKIKRKTLYWVLVEIILIAGHCVGIVFMFEDIQRDIILLACILAANLAIGVLDLQYIHLSMVLCKRYRMLNKIMAHIIKPFKTFRSEEPSHEMLQKILSYRWETVKKEEASKNFDQIWEPSEKPVTELSLSQPEQVKVDMSKMEVPPAIFMKNNDKEISREEETTVILQLDILRGIHSDLHNVGQEINQLFGFQILVHLVTSVALIVIFGFFAMITALDGKFYWPFLAIVMTPVLRVLLIGHWAQVMKDTSMKPFWTMSGMSTLDGSPKLERQVQKLGLQASQKTARISAAGYFYITRNTITRIFGMSLLFIFLLVKFDRLERAGQMGGLNTMMEGMVTNMTTAMTSAITSTVTATDGGK